ncbi:MAG: EamA family transporter [Nitrospinota bacterium]|nr:EamA family transporter [Nitrospinota bacterium]
MLDLIHPNLLALISAMLLSIAQSFYRQAVRFLRPEEVTVAANFVVGCLAFAVYLLEGRYYELSFKGVLFFSLSGLFAQFIARHFNNISYSKIGLARTQTLYQTAPIWSSIVAILFIGEKLNTSIAIGTILVVFGGMILVHEARGKNKIAKSFYYFLPVISAMFFSFSPTFRKLAFSYIPCASLGIAIASCAAIICQCFVSIFLGKKEENFISFSWHKKAVITMSLAGLFNIMTGLTFWTSIKNGNIVEVFPIRRLSLVFVIFVSWLFFKKIERLSFQVILGAVIAIAGALMVSSGS